MSVLVGVTSTANHTFWGWHVTGGAFSAAASTSVPGKAVQTMSPVIAKAGLALVQMAIHKALWQLTNSPSSDLPDPHIQRGPFFWWWNALSCLYHAASRGGAEQAARGAQDWGAKVIWETTVWAPFPAEALEDGRTWHLCERKKLLIWNKSKQTK